MEYVVRRAIYRSYQALGMCLELDSVTDSLAKCIYNAVSQYKFVAITRLTMDVLSCMGRLSKNTQSKSTDISSAASSRSTCDSLRDLLGDWGIR